MNARVESSTLACPDCDLLQELPPLPRGAKARCVRCGHVLATRPPGSARSSARAHGRGGHLLRHRQLLRRSWTCRPSGAPRARRSPAAPTRCGWRASRIVGALIAFCAIIAPGTFLAFMLTLLIAARHTPPPHWVGEMLRWAHHFEMWSMLEVMMLGIMVALIKIAEVASVETGIGMYAVFALIVLIPSIMVTFDARELWRGWNGWSAPQRRRASERASCRGSAPMKPDSGDRCEPRARLVRGVPAPVAARRAGMSRAICRRCGEKLEFRRQESIEKTWALIIAATICYIPANVLPVFTTITLGEEEPDTILSGVAFLYTSGSWPLALIVLVASVMIPLGKLAALAYLLITVQRGSIANNRERTQLYRIVEFIGRWSMLDVFVGSVHRRARAAPAADVGGARRRRAVLRRGRRADDARGGNVRSPGSSGMPSEPRPGAPWLTSPISRTSRRPPSRRRSGCGSRSSGSFRCSPRWWPSASPSSALRSEGPTITIVFKAAEGIEAGKTFIRYKDVRIGLVIGGRAVRGLLARCSSRRRSRSTRRGSWSPTPSSGSSSRASRSSGVSGLNTLLSGNYIGFQAGKSTDSQTLFFALDEPPIITDQPGRQFVLKTPTLGLARHRHAGLLPAPQRGPGRGYALAPTGSRSKSRSSSTRPTTST